MKSNMNVRSEKGFTGIKGLGDGRHNSNRRNCKSIGTEVREHSTYTRMQSSSSSKIPKGVSLLTSNQEMKNLTISL